MHAGTHPRVFGLGLGAIAAQALDKCTSLCQRDVARCGLVQSFRSGTPRSHDFLVWSPPFRRFSLVQLPRLSESHHVFSVVCENVRSVP